MKALLLSRPGDFGSLEKLWPSDPLLLPLLGTTILEAHGATLARWGIRDVRILRAHPAGNKPSVSALEKALARLSGPMRWSLRLWPLGPWPTGQSLSECLRQQALFLEQDDSLVLSAAKLILEPWTGPKVPSGFPVNASSQLDPLLLDKSGRLVPWETGPAASLTGAYDYYKTVLRLMETMPPRPFSLQHISAKAELELPLACGQDVQAAAGAHIGPLTQLTPGTRVDKGAGVSRTLVLTPVKIGREFQLHEKLVIGTKVIDPFRGDWIEVQDKRSLRSLSFPAPS